MEKIKARVVKVLFADEKSNFSICIIKDKIGSMRAKGNFLLKEKQTYNLEGIWAEDPKYGEYFSFSRASLYIETCEEGVINYLSSDVFSGVGKASAQKIYNHFGEKTLQTLKNNPELIEDVEGLTARVKSEIKKQFDDVSKENEILQLLTPLNLGEAVNNKIRYMLKDKPNGSDLIKLNPYALVNPHVDYSLSFKVADQIYRHFNDDLVSPVRIEAGLKESFFNLAFKKGDALIAKNELITTASNHLLIADAPVEEFLNQEVENGSIFEFDGLIQIREFKNVEEKIARTLMLKEKYFRPTVKIEIDEELEKFEEKNQIKLSPQQKLAIVNGINSTISIITGGPGTGKTTIVKAIVSILISKKFSELDLAQIREKIALVAPTGRASFQLSKSSGFWASTIHSLLKISQTGDKSVYNQDNPLTHEYFIIDEFSMVDMFLFSKLLSAMREDAKIIIIGDPNQLESVGPGSLLRDFINSNQFITTELDVIYRQGEGSSISLLAKKVNEDNLIEPFKDDQVSIINCSNTILDNIDYILNKSLKMGYDINDSQILFTHYRGNVGIDNINAIFNFNSNRNYITYREINYHEGDKVMLLRNMHEKDVYNGDIGYITKIIDKEAKANQDAIEITIRNKTLKLSYNQLFLITHAYAISIHKSQGSEFDVVLLPIVKHQMLSKKLIYTAITRAKKKLIILGDIKALNEGIKTNDYTRQTNLINLLKEKNEKTIN